jgi:hypothetical protein
VIEKVALFIVSKVDNKIFCYRKYSHACPIYPFSVYYGLNLLTNETITAGEGIQRKVKELFPGNYIADTHYLDTTSVQECHLSVSQKELIKEFRVKC